MSVRGDLYLQLHFQSFVFLNLFWPIQMHCVNIFRGNRSMFLTPEKKANMTISTLQKCRYELHFANMREKAKIISSNIKTWINDGAPEIEFKEPCFPRGRSSVQDQDLESYY